MAVIFTAIAHSQERPLQTLRDEDEQVHDYLSQGAQRGYFRIHREPNPTIENITKYLQAEREEIVLFLFSGHAGRNNLFFEDREANAHGIAQLLGQCPNLKLIVLNGCSTGGQVSRLMALPNQPAVIATSAPVEDRTATQFSITFFQALCQERSTVEKAFEAGLAAAQVVSRTPIPVTRSAEWEAGVAGEKSDEPVWGLFTSYPAAREWKLPNELTRAVPTDYVPNQFLINHLMQAMAPYLPSAQQIVDNEAQGLAHHDEMEKVEVIVKNLPHPIGKQVMKLFAKSIGDSKAVFYDRPGKGRLEQLVSIYRTVFELVAFVLLSELWNAVTKKGEVKTPPDPLPDMRSFFEREHSEARFDRVFTSCQAILALLSQRQVECFVEELQQDEGLFREGSDFYRSCHFMERVASKLEGVTEEEAKSLCVPAEEELAWVMGYLSFITRYNLASVKAIDVIKYRHLEEARYKHRLVSLVQRLADKLWQEEKILKNCMDCASVILHRKDDPQGAYLNLSPFLIDQNAFDEKASIDKIYHLDHYEKQADAFCFRHVYKPGDVHLIIREQQEFKIVKDQFDSFAQLVFHTPSFRQAL